MLAEDPVTGELYEVPDDEMYDGYDEYPDYEFAEAPMAYDHLGNPVGLPALIPAAAAATPTEKPEMSPSRARSL